MNSCIKLVEMSIWPTGPIHALVSQRQWKSTVLPAAQAVRKQESPQQIASVRHVLFILLALGVMGISAPNLWPSFPAQNWHGEGMFSTGARNNL